MNIKITKLSINNRWLKNADFISLEHRLFVRCDKEQWRSGSTAVVMAVDNDEMSFAWLGDSAAFILKGSSLCQRQVDKITVDHSTSNKVCWRLAISQLSGMITFRAKQNGSKPMEGNCCILEEN